MNGRKRSGVAGVQPVLYDIQRSVREAVKLTTEHLAAQRSEKKVVASGWAHLASDPFLRPRI
jgi:hypothetical protein